MKVDPAKLPKGWRGMYCEDCKAEWIAIGPDGRTHPEWRGCVMCMSRNVKVMRGAGKRRGKV